MSKHDKQHGEGEPFDMAQDRSRTCPRLVEQMSTRNRLAPILLFAFLSAFHLLTLMRFPAPFVDEGWNAGRAWAFLQTGWPFSTLDMGVIEKFEGYWTFFPRLPVWIHGQVLRLSATPSLLAMRIVSLAFGLVLLGAIYAIAKRLGGQRLALLSVLLVSMSWPFLYSAHLARTDIMAAALGFAAVALYLNNKCAHLWKSLLSGLCLGLAYEMHAHSAIFGPAIVALFFVDLRQKTLRSRSFWGFLAGVLIGLGLYAAWHILPYPQTYHTLNQLTFAVHHVPPILTLDPQVIVQAIGDMGRMLYAAYQPLIPLVIWAIVLAAKRHSKADKTLLVLAVSLAAGHTLLIRNKFMYYAILVTPALDLIVAAAVLRFLQHRWRGRLYDYAYHVFVWGLLAASIALNLSVLRMDFQADYRLAQSRINQVVQPGESIMAAQVYWFGLYDHVYYSWEKLRLYQRYEPGSTLEDALRHFYPDIIIIDDKFLGSFIVDPDQEGDLYLETLGLPRPEMEAFLQRYANPLTTFDGGYYGQMRVYRINWEERRNDD